MKEWLKEAEESLAQALDALKGGDVPEQNLYMLAPIFYSERQRTNNDSLLKEMAEVNERQVAQDWSCDEESKYQYKYHYVSSYLYCFVVAGKIDEFKYDEIMEYVTGVMDVFTDDYGT